LGAASFHASQSREDQAIVSGNGATATQLAPAAGVAARHGELRAPMQLQSIRCLLLAVAVAANGAGALDGATSAPFAA